MSALARNGSVCFNDASLSVWEEPGRAAMDNDAWESAIKKDVFARIVQQLNRMGWTCEVPAEMVNRYSLSFARNYRSCRKGDLHGELRLGGRHIEFAMWQELHNVSNRNGGRYDFDKEQRMPYLLRLQMQITRCRLRDYLVNVFDGYVFTPERVSSPNPDPLAYFNASWDGEYEKRRGTHRFERGPDGWPSERAISSWDRKDADGRPLSHGEVRWMRDRQGRLRRGRVYGGINGMWMLVYGPGPRDHTHESARNFFTYAPDMPRKQVPEHHRKKRLQAELARAVSAMNFERAAVLREVLCPEGITAGTAPATTATLATVKPPRNLRVRVPAVAEIKECTHG
ncbi:MULTISPECIES: UvrB/UvrC motif-containing protein [unclassified Stenotrophomonas]|uniref:UvrB/UvrC motif-containing protein n=1 Tax=unclassified Stenotrophomonas TaxID=196198 RepID=UPI002118E621|nr:MULTISPECIES: UvrB/UvrC motif-containing protein [unclassified Stenotrophomonas]